MNPVNLPFLRNVNLPVIIALITNLILVTGCHVKDHSSSLTEIERGFRTIPDSIQLAAYWYWISDNISGEGVIKDLESMKDAGINRAFIGNIGENSLPYGEHKILSDEWWEITHTALKKASELGIEIGIFNSPGWSQSGGPWIKSNESMRYLASSSVEVKGPERISIPLPEVGENAEDVTVIAFPVSENKMIEKEWVIIKRNGVNETLTMKLPDGTIARSLSIQINNPVKTNATLYYKDNNEYKLLKSFTIDRSNPALNVGFIQYPPVIISIPEIETDDYKLIIDGPGQGEIYLTLSSKPQVERYPEKTLAKMFQTPLPLWHDYMWEKQPEISEWIL